MRKPGSKDPHRRERPVFVDFKLVSFSSILAQQTQLCGWSSLRHPGCVAISPELGTFQCLALMAKLPTFAALLPLGYRVVRARGIKACVGSSAVNLRKSKINCYHFPTSHRVILDYMRTTCLTSVSGTSGISFLSTGSLWKREKICNPFLKGWVSRVSCDSQIVFQTLVRAECVRCPRLLA